MLRVQSDETVAECAIALIDVLPALARIASEGLQGIPEEERLTPAQYRFLSYLVEGDCLSGELARCLGVTPSSVTTTVDILEQRGLVERAGSRTDRRCIRVRATPTGRAALTATRARMIERATDLVTQLPLEQRRELAEGLTALRAAQERCERSIVARRRA